MTVAAEEFARPESARPESAPPPRPLHVVQVSRDETLLDPARNAEPLARQRAYARELEAERPGSRMTILVLARDTRSEIRREALALPGLTIVPLVGRVRGLARLLPALLRLHRERKIDVVTTQSPFEELWITRVFARLRGVPVVGQIHFDVFATAWLDGPGGALRRLHRRIALWGLRGLDRVRVVSSAVRNEILRRGFHARVVVSPVPVAALERRSSEPSPVDGDRAANGPPHVVFVGRLAREKNLVRWLEIAKRVADVEPRALFDVVGEGPCEAELRAHARTLGLEDRLRWHGFLRNEQIDDFFRDATALLLTSDDEAFGRVLVEAAAVGTPSVTTRSAGAVDVVVDGETGFVHAHDDVEGMASSLVRLIREPLLRARMGRAAALRVRRCFAPAALRRAWIEILVSAARPDTGAAVERGVSERGAP